MGEFGASPQGFSVRVRKDQFGATNTVKTNEFRTERFQSGAINGGPFPIAEPATQWVTSPSATPTLAARLDRDVLSHCTVQLLSAARRR
jgi:hypothetical protein